nr:Protein VAB-19 [Haemonchus contortus]
MSTRRRAADKCRCCPYGFHIDVDFVAYAEDVRKGGTTRTSSLPRKNGERSLMSPLDSIFSDSLENILSDFDDALGVSELKALLTVMLNILDSLLDQMPFVKNQTLPRQQRSRLLPRDVDKLMNTKRVQDGYASDHTGYYTGGSVTERRSDSATMLAPRQFALDFNAPPKPFHQPSQASQSSAYTALGRTITEIKARNTESPFPERDIGSRIGSRVGTPIDLGLPNHNINTSLSRPRTPRRLETDRERVSVFLSSQLSV